MNTNDSNRQEPEETLVVRALRTQQGPGIELYAFFLYGSDITKIADISRLERDDHDEVKGFQRRDIKNHISSIVDYLNSDNPLFPNAIILAIGSEVEFKQSRGPLPHNAIDLSQSGNLCIPVLPEGRRVAWIVDGQQRSLALAQAKNNRIPVPVIAFVSPGIDLQREQFVLVNKAKPLPTRLINELLPTIDVILPRDLAKRKLPSQLCDLLNKDSKSPFHNLIIRESDTHHDGVIVDTAIIESIKRNLRSPMGSLSQFKMGPEPNIAAMYDALIMYWDTVKDIFPEAWGLRPKESRLMHSAGIKAMGRLMDQIMMRADTKSQPHKEITISLKRIRPFCRWTEGIWEDLGWNWNDIQSTAYHISRLSEFLIRLDREMSRAIQ
ncbi:DGQHR domain-containing protein DpdB [Chlorobium phaeovibrioides]|uniref:DGQHR domain-containing protein DpdB n=1 Tax=Chlorobium phaeovibrioides TaxID=1094 RepID=UPI00123178A8|nr:DGQHR domain-containing protein DpdB [Chlorobium phaeovibrioides]QEQ57696.1 DGQHR domain-containing protein [Chlorobium phaeovibrioides]